MEEEAADELLGGEGHGLVSHPSLGAVVLRFEGHALLVQGDEPLVGDGHAVGITGKVVDGRDRAGGIGEQTRAA